MMRRACFCDTVMQRVAVYHVTSYAAVSDTACFQYPYTANGCVENTVTIYRSKICWFDNDICYVWFVVSRVDFLSTISTF